MMVNLKCMTTPCIDIRDWHTPLTPPAIFYPGCAPLMKPQTAVGSPNIVEMGGGKLRMYYSGTSKDGTCGIGCAEGSVDDLSKWERCEVSVSAGAAVPSIADQLSTAIGE